MESRALLREYGRITPVAFVKSSPVFRTWRWFITCWLLLCVLPMQLSAQGASVVANAGPDQVAEVGRRVDLDGRASRGAGLTYRWQQIAGPPVMLEAATMPVAWFIYPFLPGLDVRTLAFELTVTDASGLTATDTTFVMEALLPPPPALTTLTIPEPTQLGNYVRDRQAAIQLGKALFWDMQVGSDGVQACATCHYAAGVDRRISHQRHPGADGEFATGSPLSVFQTADFPFHQVRDPLSSVQEVIRSIDDVAGSQGVVRTDFSGVHPGGRIDAGVSVSDPMFHADGLNLRQVTGRNAPSVINAVFNLRNFWDGRASYVFNGVNHLGVRDPQAHVWSVQGGAVAPEYVRLDKASLASQAVGPANHRVEMAWNGRRFPDLGRKLLSLQPLAGQRVDPTDSVLGALAAPEGGLQTNYATLIQAAFAPRFWDASDILVYDAQGIATVAPWPGRTLQANEFTLIETNFSLFFGLAIQLYEATLVSDQAPYDRYQQGDATALTEQQVRGQHLFMNVVQCVACHAGSEFTNATVNQFFAMEAAGGGDVGALIERMATADNTLGIYDLGFYNIGVRPTAEDAGIGGIDLLGYPLSASRLAQLGTPIGPPLTLNPVVNPSEYAAVNGAFKVPSLRNVELTAPYMHNGGMATLTQVVEFYARGSDFRAQNLHDLAPAITPLPISRSDVEDLVAFLTALTDERVRRSAAPFDHPQLFIPDGDKMLEVPAIGAAGGPPLETFADGAPDFILSLEAPTIVHAGAPMTATLSVTNTGAFNLRDLASTTTLPGCSWNATDADAWASGVLEIGEVWRIQCVTTVETSGVYTATSAATNRLGQVVRKIATHTVQVIRPALTLSVVPDRTEVAAGATITFTYSVINSGDTPLTAMTLHSSLTGVHPIGDGMLAPGAQGVVVAAYKVPRDAVAPQANLVRVQGLSVATMQVVADHATTLDILPATLQMAIDSSPTIPIGSTAHYRVRIENTGSLTLYNLSVRAWQAGTLLAAINALAPGAYITVTGALMADESALPGPLVESLTASAHTAYSQPVTATQTLTWGLETAPGLTLVHTLTPSVAQIGETVRYSYVLTNTGRVTLHNIALFSPRFGTPHLVHAALAPGEHVTGAWQFVVTEHDLPAPMQLRVEARGENAVAAAQATTASTLTLAIQSQSGLALTALSPTGAARSGDSVIVRVQVTNTGDVTLDNLVLDTTPPTLWTLGSSQLAPGATTGGEVRFPITEATQPGPALLTISARASPRHGGVVSAATTNALIPMTRTAALAVEVITPAQAQVGEEVDVTVKIHNIGDATLTDLRVQMPPSDLAENVGAELAPGQTLMVTMHHRVDEASLPGPLPLQVSATAQTRYGAGELVRAAGSAMLALAAQPALEVQASSSPTTATIGSDVFVVYHVRNTGNVTLVGVRLRDVRTGEIALSAETLAPNATLTGAARYRVAVTDSPGPLRSEAVATAQTTYGQSVGAATAIVVDVLTQPGLAVTAARTGVVAVGETPVIEYTITNQGDLPVSALEVVDGKGELLTLASTTLDPGAALALRAPYAIASTDLPGPLLHTISVRGRASDGSIVQVRGSAILQLAPPGVSLVHLHPGERQLATVGDASLAVETPRDFTPMMKPATHLDLTLAKPPPMVDRRPEGMTVQGFSLAMAIYVDGEPSPGARFTEPLYLITPTPAVGAWVAYRWDELSASWSRADVEVVTNNETHVTVRVERMGVIALFTPQITLPSPSTWLYIPVVRR